jgi:hypothetical protein
VTLVISQKNPPSKSCKKRQKIWGYSRRSHSRAGNVGAGGAFAAGNRQHISSPIPIPPPLSYHHRQHKSGMPSAGQINGNIIDKILNYTPEAPPRLLSDFGHFFGSKISTFFTKRLRNLENFFPSNFFPNFPFFS